jgi:hypothetical protein
MNYPYLFVVISGTINLALVLYSIGYLRYDNKYISFASTALRLFVGIILILTYNPFYPLRRRMKQFDDRVAFSAGMYITIINILTAYNSYVQT